MVCKNKTYFCAYCDGVGSVFVEASDKSVSRWLTELTEERRQSILEDVGTNGDDPEV
jgi:hypothetical protein